MMWNNLLWCKILALARQSFANCLHFTHFRLQIKTSTSTLLLIIVKDKTKKVLTTARINELCRIRCKRVIASSLKTRWTPRGHASCLHFCTIYYQGVHLYIVMLKYHINDWPRVCHSQYKDLHLEVEISTEDIRIIIWCRALQHTLGGGGWIKHNK